MKIFFHFVVFSDNDDQSFLHLGEAAIHKQFGSRDVATVVGREKHHGLGDLIGCAEPAETYALNKISRDFGASLKIPVICF